MSCYLHHNVLLIRRSYAAQAVSLAHSGKYIRVLNPAHESPNQEARIFNVYLLMIDACFIKQVLQQKRKRKQKDNSEVTNVLYIALSETVQELKYLPL